MEHSFLDKYGNIDSIIHKSDPRIKLALAFIFIVFVILTQPTAILLFCIYLLMIFLIIFLSRISIVYVVKRSMIIIPFVVFVTLFIPFIKEGQIAGSFNTKFFSLKVTYSGLWIFWNVLIKSWLAILIMTILSATTNFSKLLKALEFFRVPKILIMLLGFMYRYIFLLLDETMRMKRAYNSRYFGGHTLKQIKIIGNMIASLFIRTYERGESVYMAMCSRGFEYGKSSRNKKP